MAGVTLQNVNKVYPDQVRAVQDLSIEVADGELVVLAGPSGSGKSTTLRLVAGLEECTSGDIWIGQRRVTKTPPSDRDIAMVFQEDALYPHLTVRRNLEFGLRVRRTPRREVQRRVDQAARLLSIQGLLDRRPRQLSGGERQRVAVGRAMVRDPAVFLFDEPLSNLDARLRGQMRTEIAMLHERLGATMLYVTHDQVEAMTLADRLVLIDDGKVRQIGVPLEIYRRPANRFAATFIGSPAMNLFPGEVTDGRFQFAGCDAHWPLANAPPGRAVLGVRPEHLLPAGDGDRVLAEAQRTIVEHLGHEVLVHFTLAGTTAASRLSADRAANLSSAGTSLTIQPGTAHLFAPDQEGRVLRSECG